MRRIIMIKLICKLPTLVIHSIQKVILDVIVLVFSVPRRCLQSIRRLFHYVFNIYVMFWCLKFLQRSVLDPFLQLAIGMSTTNGWKNETLSRYTIQTSAIENNDKDEKQVALPKEEAKNIECAKNQLKVCTEYMNFQN